MRSYKLTLAALFTLAPVVLGLAACTRAEPETPEPPDAAQAGARPVEAQPRGEPVTPAADLSAATAIAASQEAGQSAGSPAAQEDVAPPDPFPGEADIMPTLGAVAGFCARPGSLAYMTGDGCRAALSELSRTVVPKLHFESMDECLGFLRKLRAERNRIVDEHRAWCQARFVNLHDRKGCYDAAQVFLGSFTEQGFCRKAPPPVKKAVESKKAPKDPKAAQAPYISGYREPGQKFDSPKSGPMPSAVKAKPAPAKKGADAKPTAAKPEVPATARSTAPAAEALPGAASAAAPAAPDASPAASAPLIQLPAPAAAPSRPAETDLGAARPQSLNATTGPNSVSPTAVPDGVLATSGGQVPASASLPPQTGQSAAPPASAASPAADDDSRDFPEPAIGPREEVTPLPPVPSLGRIAPPLMPGVPPDTAVTDNTLPAPDAAPVEPPATTQPGQVRDAFEGIIPNARPLPPPGQPGADTDAMPVSGTPAGQSAE